jgi:hypothetical protein
MPVFKQSFGLTAKKQCAKVETNQITYFKGVDEDGNRKRIFRESGMV